MTPEKALLICASMVGTDNSYESINIFRARGNSDAFECTLSKQVDPDTDGDRKVLAYKRLVPAVPEADPCVEGEASVYGKCIEQSCIEAQVDHCKGIHAGTEDDKTSLAALLTQDCTVKNKDGDVTGYIIGKSAGGIDCTGEFHKLQACINRRLICTCGAPVPDTSTGR